MKVPFSSALLVLVACKEAPSPSVPMDTGEASISLAFIDGVALSEALAVCDRVSVVAPHQRLCLHEGEAWWVDESDSAPRSLGPAGALSGALVGETPWVLLDGALYALIDGALMALPLDLPAPVSELRRAGGRTWLWGVGRLFEVRDTDVHEIVVAGAPEIHAWAASEGALYLATPELLALRWVDEAWAPSWAWAEPVSDLAVDAEGRLWAIVDGELYLDVGGEGPTQVALPEAARAVVGPALWVSGDEGLYHLEGRTFARFGLDGDLVAVDGLGRALLRSEGALWRYAVGRPVAVVGLPEELTVQQEVLLLPSDPATVTALSVWAGAQALPLEAAPWRVTLDPDTLPEGEQALRIFTESELGDNLHMHPLWVGALPEVQWPQVQAIGAAHCSECHSGDTATRLETADDWRTRIDRVIELVSAGDMPLGNPPLADEDVVTLRAWRQGGFQ